MSQETVIYFVLRYMLFEAKKCKELSLNTDWDRVYNFLEKHAIASVSSEIVGFIPSDQIEIKTAWKGSIYSCVFKYSQLCSKQNQILSYFLYNKIPVVVLKGTSAARYYPKPQLRLIGDIDLLTKPNDYERAVQCLIVLGCIETTNRFDEERGRHRTFIFNDIVIELHKFFSSYVNGGNAMVLDGMLFDAIPNNATILPDDENGLVLLNHIAQHLENGLGLRQIIDWVMFVNSYLNDDIWYSTFQNKAIRTGLEVLAKVTTKMCQMYLGLRKEDITWCKDVADDVCVNLMQYVMKCGDFGRSREIFQSSGVSNVPSWKQPFMLAKYIQTHGEDNWKALRKHPWLKPFAWMYQSCKYIKMAVQNRVGVKRMKSIYDEGQKRNDMFTALGIKIEHS